MEKQIDTAEKKVLVGVVRYVQKRGMKGSKGDWKEFLNSYDKKFGASLSDPSKRSHEALAAFLKTFVNEQDLQLIAQRLQCHSDNQLVKLFIEKSGDNETPEQKLVRETLDHPSYQDDYKFPSFNEGWVVIQLKKISRVLRSTKMLAIDCEMVLCEDGSEAVVQVCIVDRNLQVKLHERVNPKKAIADYRSYITGVTAEDLDGVTCTLADIQNSMKNLLSTGTILVGHGLHNDLRALQVDYVRVIDTSYVFDHLNRPVKGRPSLRNLCKTVLGYDLREEGAPHNCLNDACAAMKLVLAKVESRVDSAVPFVQMDVPETDMAKLLLHRIPASVNVEKLRKLIPGNFTIEIKPSKKPPGENYSALAIFDSPQEALQAYENVIGKQEKDSLGRPQKLVVFHLPTGEACSIYVRKMSPDNSHYFIPSKRAPEAMEISVNLKRSRNDPTFEDQSDSHIKDNRTSNELLREIETLKRELKKKDTDLKQRDLELETLKQELEKKDTDLKNREYEISVLNQIVSSSKKRAYRHKIVDKD